MYSFYVTFELHVLYEMCNTNVLGGEFSEAVLDILGGESSQALHGILPASVGEPADKPLNLSSEYVFLTPVEAPEGEPSTSTSIAQPDPPQEVRVPESEPERRR